MPVDPNYLHADTPHEKTIQRADYLYGCSSVQHSYFVASGAVLLETYARTYASR